MNAATFAPIVVTLIINCVISIVFALLISYCESHRTCFIVHPDVSNKQKMRQYYDNNEQYRLLVKQYEDLSKEYFNVKGDGVAKFCVTCVYISILAFFIKVLLKHEIPIFVILLIFVISITLLLIIVFRITKELDNLRKFKKEGKGQKYFPAVFGIFFSNAEMYSYIENINDVNDELNDIDRIIFRLTERISALKYLQRVEHIYATYWLIFATISSTFVCTLFLNI